MPSTKHSIRLNAWAIKVYPVVKIAAVSCGAVRTHGSEYSQWGTPQPSLNSRNRPNNKKRLHNFSRFFSKPLNLMHKQQTSLTALWELHHPRPSTDEPIKWHRSIAKHPSVLTADVLPFSLLISIGTGEPVGSHGGIQSINHSQLVELEEKLSLCGLTQP